MAAVDAAVVPETPVPYSLPASVPRPRPVAQVGCASHAARICDGGDVWWADSCGLPEERVEACDETLCLGGKCLPAPRGPRCPPSLWEGSACDGETLRYCDQGTLVTVDCAAKGKHCGPDDVGEASCVEPRPCSGADVCADRSGVRVCDRGQARLVPCARGSRCMTVSGRARCVRELSDGCGPTAETDDTELELPIIAFVVAENSGSTSESEERIRASVTHAAAAFARADHDTHVRITLRDMIRDPELSAVGDGFFVPVVFTRELTIGEKHVAGLGTLPAGSCGGLGMRASSNSPRGLIVLSRLRNASTLEHELGHYLGLCHTHQPDSSVPEIVVDSNGYAVPAPPSCQACNRTGDGICDTPVDPGLEACTLDPDRCTTTCTSSAAPDPANLMSYYSLCRRYFSNEQISYLRQFVRTRKAAVEKR